MNAIGHNRNDCTYLTWSRFRRWQLASGTLLRSRLQKFGYSMVDQALSVGGVLLVNVALARTQTREAYGMFVLAYTGLTFLLGLHNAAILEPFTVYGSGRYHSRLAGYSRLMFWSNGAAGVILSAFVLGFSVALREAKPHLLPQAVVGLGFSVSFLLLGAWLRRAFYLQRRASLAAAASLIFFITVACGLWLTAKAHVLSGSSVFLVLAAGWLVASLCLAGRLPSGKTCETFLAAEPGYWSEHWKYARWVLSTAFVFQLTSQGHYWLVAGILSVREVAELKAMILIVAPAEQIFIALDYLTLPLLSAHYAATEIGRLLSAWKLYAMAITAVTVSFFLLIRVVGRPLTHLLYGGRYDDAAPLLIMLVLLPIVMGVGHTMNAALKAAESPQLVFWAYVASGAVTFAVGVPLVVHFGLRGAVYGMLCSGASYTVALAVGFIARFYAHASEPVAVSTIL